MAQFYNITGTSKNIFQIGYNGPILNKTAEGLKITLNNSLSSIFGSALYFADNKSAYINSTNYTGTAAAATKATQDGDGKVISSTYMKLSGTSALAGAIIPSKTASYNLGSADKTFGTVYATGFVGALTGNADTATKATQDGDGKVISSTYMKLSGTSALTGNIIPSTTNAVEIGSSSKKYKNVYATTFTGDLEGNAKTATIATTAESATSALSAEKDSAGNIISTTYIKLSGTTALAGNIVPSTNNTRNLGSSDKVFANVYATKFTGDLEGNAKTATTATSANSATKATQDADGNVISSTYQKVISGWQVSNSSGSYVINNTNNTAAKLILPSVSTSNPTWNNKKIMLESDVENMIADMNTSGMTYSGTISTLTEFNNLKDTLTETNKGNFYKVATAFDIYEVGDSLIWNGSSFDAIQSNIQDAVTNPTTSTSGQIAVFTANNVIKGTNADEISVGSAASATKDSVGNTISTYYQPKVTALGSTTEPVYISAAGTFSKGSKYAGGSLVKLNNSSKASASAEFYAPTAGGALGTILIGGGTTSAPTWLAAGASGQILVSKGADSPVWTTPSSITVGKATTAESATTATTATNIAGGAAGKIVYQSTANKTAFLDTGTSGQLLKSQGSGKAPVWFSPNYKEITYTDNTNLNSLITDGQYYISSVTLGSTALSGILDVKVDAAKKFDGTSTSINQTFYANDGTVWYRNQAKGSTAATTITSDWKQILDTNGNAIKANTANVANTVKVSTDDSKNYYLAGFDYSSNNTNDIIYKTKRARISTDGSLYLADNNTNGATITFNVTSGNITFSKNGNSTEYVLTLPTKTGTLATTDDVNAVTTNVSNNYLKLTGGTISNTTFAPLTIERKSNTSGTASAISFKNANGVLGYIGMQGSANGGLIRYGTDTSKAYLVLDQGNVETELNDVYLRQDGGSLTGALTSNSNITAANLIKSGGTASQILMADGSTIEKSTLQAAGSYVTTNTAQTITANKTFTESVITSNNKFEIKANSNNDDSWIKLTNATDAGYYAFGIRRPYDTYGLQLKIHSASGTDDYYNIWHAGNDGSGSKLDADLLDGKHASAFATSDHTHDNYLTEEKDTLQTVTDRGTTTTKSIKTAGLTTTSTLYVTGTTGHREGIRISPYGGLSSIWWNASGTQDYTTGQMWGITAYTPSYKTDTTKVNTFRFRGPSSDSASSATDQMWIDVNGLVTSRGGFKKDGSSNNYVLLAGGGTKLVSEFVTTDTSQTISGEKTFSKDVNISGQTNTSSYLNPGVVFLNGTTELAKISANSSGNLGFSYNGTAAKYIFGPEVLRPNTSFNGQINLGQSDARFKGYFTTLDLTGALSSTSTISSEGFVHTGIEDENTRDDYLLTADGSYVAKSTFQTTAAMSNYVTTNTTQTISGKKTITNTLSIQDGSAAGAFVLGADVNAKTMTASKRKLGRMGVPAYTANGSSVTSTVAGISFDSQSKANYVDFGGHPNNTASIAPDVIRFVVADTHDNKTDGTRSLALQISKQSGLVDEAGGGTSVAAAKFFIPVISDSSLSTDTLELTNESAVNHILFKRAGWNYISAPNSGGTMAFIAGNGTAVTANNASLAIRSDCLLPGLRDNVVSIGGTYNSTTYHFKNLYLKGKIYNGSYNYTLPSKTGILALTTDIPTGYSSLANWSISQDSDKNLIIKDTQTNGAYLTLPTGVNTATTSRPSWNGSNLVTVADIEDFVKDTEALKWKGVIASQTEYNTLISDSTTKQVGDFYKISTAFGNFEAGDSLIWNGESFDVIQGNIDVDALKDSIINTSYWANVPLSKTSSKTTTPTFGQVKIESGNAAGGLVIGGDSGSTGITTGARKLARITMPGNGSSGSDKNICLISGDTSGDGSSVFGSGDTQNRVEFGGRLGDGTNTSPDSMAFTVATTHNGVGATNKIYALEINKDKAYFKVPVEATKFVNTSVTTNADKTVLLADGSTKSITELSADIGAGYLPLAGGTMTGESGIRFPTAAVKDKPTHFISAGTGYGTGSGVYGLKVLALEQDNCQSGLGHDLTNLPGTYELTLAGTKSGTAGYISFALHSTKSTTYDRLGYFNNKGEFYTTSDIYEGGTKLSSKYSNYVKIDIASTTSTTSGTLTADQLTDLKANPHRTVLNWAGYYCFAENLSDSSTWYYSANCTFGTNSIDKKVISINTSTGAWEYDPYTYSKINTKYLTTEDLELPITTRYNNTTGATKYTEESKYVEGVTVNPSTKTITATKFNGLATKATQDGSGNVIVDTYAKKQNSIYYVTGNSTDTTTSWSGTIHGVTEAYEGLTIAFKTTKASAKGLKLTLYKEDGNTLIDAIAVYRNNSAITSHLTENSVVIMVYDGTYWRWTDYDGNTNTYQRLYVSSTDVEYPITTRYNVTSGNSYYNEYGRYSEGVTLNPSTNTITASYFKGSLTGDNVTANTITSDTVTSGLLKGVLESPATARLSTLDFAKSTASDGYARFRVDLSTSTNTVSNPGNGYISTYFWDNQTDLRAQLYIPSRTTQNEGRPAIRLCEDGTWDTSWTSLALLSDIPTSIKNIKIDSTASTDISTGSIYHSTAVENSKYYNILRTNYSSTNYYNELALPVTGSGLWYRKTENSTTPGSWIEVLDSNNVKKYAAKNIEIEINGTTYTGKGILNETGVVSIDISAAIDSKEELASSYVTLATKQNIKEVKSFGAGVELVDNVENVAYNESAEGCQMKYNSTKKCVQFIFS